MFPLQEELLEHGMD